MTKVSIITNRILISAPPTTVNIRLLIMDVANDEKYLEEIDDASNSFNGAISQDHYKSYNKRNGELTRWNDVLGLDMTMLEIEELFSNLVNKMDQRVVDLVMRTKSNANGNSDDRLRAEDIENLKETSEQQWKWLSNIAEIVQKHVKNASEYHLYHQTLLQYQLSLPQIGFSELSKITGSNCGSVDSNDLLGALKIQMTIYLTWWQKIEIFISQCRKLCPISTTVASVNTPIKCTMLIDYKLDKIILRKEENVFLKKGIDGGDTFIENNRQERIYGVPSICYELSPPDNDLTEGALQLRLNLLASWTITMKELGCVLMKYIASIMDRYGDIDLTACQDYSDDSKDNLYRSLCAIESMLNSYWKDSSELLFIQSEINAMRSQLEIKGDDNVDSITYINRNKMFIDASFRNLDNYIDTRDTSMSQFNNNNINNPRRKSIKALVTLFKELHRYWDKYRQLINNSSLLSLKESQDNLDEMISKSSETLMSDDVLDTYSYDRHSAISPSIQETLISSKHSSPLQCLSRPNLMTERRISVHNRNSLPRTEKSSSTDINQYFTSSLLPKRGSVIRSPRKPITRSFTISLETTPDLDIFGEKKKKVSAMPTLPTTKEWNRNIYWEKNRIQPYFMVLTLPRTDRIEAIIDKRFNKPLSPSEAQKEGLADEHFLEILDTSTNLKFRFNEAVVKGLVSLTPVNRTSKLARSTSMPGDNFTKAVYKIDSVFDPDKEEWINLRHAVDRNIVNCHSGQIKLNKVDYCHILSGLATGNVRGKRIFNCNIRTLPPEMTIMVPTVIEL